MVKIESIMTKIEDFFQNLVKTEKICYFLVNFAWKLTKMIKIESKMTKIVDFFKI